MQAFSKNLLTKTHYTKFFYCCLAFPNFEGEGVLLDIAFAVGEGNLAAILLARIYSVRTSQVKSHFFPFHCVNLSFLKLYVLFKRMTLQVSECFLHGYEEC